MATLAHTRMALRRPATRLAAAGSISFVLGVLVYLTDRDTAHSTLIPAVPLLAGLQLFGAAGAWLPSLLHPFAFALLTAAVQPPNAAPAYWACVLWWGIDVAFEASQSSPIGDFLAPILQLPPWPAQWTAAVGRFAAAGSFDVADLLATTAGACAAAAVLRSIRAQGADP